MRLRNILIILGIVALLGGAYAWREYNRTSEKADEMDTVLVTTAEKLFEAFTSDEAAANAHFVGTSEQAIEVDGVIRSVEDAGDGKSTVVLETGDAMAGIVCEFAKAALPASWKTGDTVQVKGICTGVNDLIPDVIMVRCAALE